MNCFPFTRAQNDHTICRADRCTKTEIIREDGTCGTCPYGTIADQWGKKCIKEEDYAIATYLMALENDPQISNDLSEDQKEDDNSGIQYVIIASAVGIVVLIGVISFVYYMRNRE